MSFVSRCVVAGSFLAALCNAYWSVTGNQALALDLPRAGVNLAAYNYWGTALPFFDVARMGDQWHSASLDGVTLNVDRTITVNALDYPASLAPDEIARTSIFTHNGEHFPTGQYVLRWSGKGNVQLVSSPGVTVVSRTTGQVIYNVTETNPNGLWLVITQTDPTDPVWNVGLHAPLTNGPGAFNPKYKADLANYGVIRYIDWNMTNNHTISKWADRTAPYDFHWGTAAGVPYESQIQLSNDVKHDMWLTVPHLADDDYVRKLAKMVVQHLDPSLRVWVEYSNEVWNGSFEQYNYANDVLLPRYGVENAAQAYGRRSAEIFDIFSQEFTNQQRIIRVIGGQSANPWVLGQSLAGATVGGTLKADVAAVAPYFTVDIDQLYQQHLAGTVNLDDVFTQLRGSIDSVTNDVVANRETATARGLPLVAYEGGQHLVARPGDQHNNASFVELLQSINRDPRMGDAYTYFLDQWYAAGGKTMVFYSDVGTWSKWGSFGLKEDYLDDGAAKYRAVQQYLQQMPSLPVDVNQEGFGVWRSTYGSTTNLQADANGDGVVDGADYVFWRRSGFNALAGATSMVGQSGLQAVPEPGSLSLSMVAVVLLYGRCFQR